MCEGGWGVGTVRTTGAVLLQDRPREVPDQGLCQRGGRRWSRRNLGQCPAALALALPPLTLALALALVAL